MKLHALTDCPPPELGEALEHFEHLFSYPLGPEDAFRIEHGRAYLPFFQAMGPAVAHVAEEAGEVRGTLVQVERQLEIRKTARIPVSPETLTQTAHYLCDLKVHPQARRSRVLASLLTAARTRIESHPSPHPAFFRPCYAVVMAGTGRLPVDYTGRLGIPVFRKLAEITLLRLSPAGSLPDSAGVIQTTAGEFEILAASLQPPGCSPVCGASHRRSRMPAVFLADLRGKACGLLEDTRAGKRLFQLSGPEMKSAHLSRFRWRSPEAGARILRAALREAMARNLSALFVSIPARLTPAFLPRLSGLNVRQAPAGIFGHDLPEHSDWWINTAEI